MKILQVLEPGKDGVFRHMEGLIHFLVENGCLVDLAFSSVRGSGDLEKLIQFVHDNGGNTVDLRITNIPSLKDLAAVWKIRKLAAERHPDVIHAHSSKAGALLRLTRPFFGKTPLFYTPHAYYSMGKEVRGKLVPFHLIEKLLAGIGTTINISQDEADYAQRSLGVDPAQQRIIHNPVSEAFFTTRTAEIQARARQELGIPENAIVLGTVARLALQKDPETLYRAFAKIQDEFPTLLLLHLGEGSLHDEVVQLARDLKIVDRLTLLKYRDRPITAYEAMDALVMSSRYEAGWPISILEAMAQNLPIITTLCPGCYRIAESSLSHCWTAPVGDPDALAAALRAWLLDRHNLRPSNHRDMAREQFSVQKCYGAVLEEYRKASLHH